MHADLRVKRYNHRMLDFLASVCGTAGRSEQLQVWVAQLLIGIESDDNNPHDSNLIFHMRLLARPDEYKACGFSGFKVQVSTTREGRKRPPYQPDPEEVAYEERQEGKRKGVDRVKADFIEDEQIRMKVTHKDKWDEDEEDIANLKDVMTEEEREEERKKREPSEWCDIVKWLPRQKEVGDLSESSRLHDIEVSEGIGTPEEVRYFRSQLALYVQLAQGNNATVEATLRLLTPLDLLLTIAEDNKLMPQDRQLACELITHLYVDSTELEPVGTSLIRKLAFWNDPLYDFVVQELRKNDPDQARAPHLALPPRPHLARLSAASHHAPPRARTSPAHHRSCPAPRIAAA